MINVSIIIPHYNSTNLLEKLLLSIPNYKDIETIVVDDKSDREIKEYTNLKNDPRFDHIVFLNNTSEKKGAGTCRNIGLKKAKGKWILFADSDDFFLDSFYKTLQKYFDSDYDLIYFKPISIYIDTNQQSTRHLLYTNLIDNYRKHKNIESELKLRYQFPVPWSKMIKRELIYTNNITFDEVIAMNDIMFSTKVGFYANRIHAVDKEIYCVTRSSGSLTTNLTEEIIDSRIQALIRYKEFLDRYLSYEEKEFLNFSSMYELQRIYHSGLGFRKVLEAYFRFKKNNINLFKKSMLKPSVLFNKTKTSLSRIIGEKKYYRRKS